MKGVRDLQSPNKVAGLYTQANEPLFAPSPRWTVSVRPSHNRPPTDRMADRPPSASFRSTASVFNLQGNTLPLTRLGRSRVSEWSGAAQLNLEIHNSEREGDRLPRPPRPGPSTVAQRLVYSEKWPDQHREPNLLLI